MTKKHLSDKEIQDYCLNHIPDTGIEVHLFHCKDCSLKIAEYKALFSSLDQQPFTAFDFNLSELVMKQLPVKKEKYAFDKYFFYSMSLAIIITVGVLMYPLKKYLHNIIIHFTTFYCYLIIIPAFLILVFLCADTYYKFKSKMNSLNFI